MPLSYNSIRDKSAEKTSRIGMNSSFLQILALNQSSLKLMIGASQTSMAEGQNDVPLQSNIAHNYLTISKNLWF